VAAATRFHQHQAPTTDGEKISSVESGATLVGRRDDAEGGLRRCAARVRAQDVEPAD
jgi:hypothetical protein